MLCPLPSPLGTPFSRMAILPLLAMYDRRPGQPQFPYARQQEGQTTNENRRTSTPRQPKRLRHPLLRKTIPAPPTATPGPTAPLSRGSSEPHPANPFRLRNGLHPKRNQTLPERHKRNRPGRPTLEKTSPPQTSRSRTTHTALPPPKIP